MATKMPSIRTTLLLLASAITKAAATTLVNSTACASVHIILARGTTEGYPGALGSLALLVTEANPGANYENIIYPATQETSTDSYSIGRKASREQITAYIENCPKSKVVVLAYSQGALDLGDAIAGGGGPGEELVAGANYSRPLASKIGEHISAMVFYGNPRHMPGQPYNIYDIYNTNATGKYPRTTAQLAALLPYAERFHDYCDLGDGVCSSGTNLTAHLVYPSLWDTHAAAFIQSRLDMD